MANFLNREALLAKDKLEIAKVEFDDGSYVFVRQMTGHERDVYEQSLLKKTRDSKGNVTGYEQSIEEFRAKLAAITLCDEEGKSLLKFEEWSILSRNMNSKKLDQIAAKAQEINRITEEAKEELIKNLNVAPGDNSSLDSVGN